MKKQLNIYVKKFFEYDRVSVSSRTLQFEFKTVLNAGKKLCDSVYLYQAVLSQICVIYKYLLVNHTFRIKSVFLAPNS